MKYLLLLPLAAVLAACDSRDQSVPEAAEPLVEPGLMRPDATPEDMTDKSLMVPPPDDLAAPPLHDPADTYE